MKRNLKALGLALVAMVAMSAIVAQAAQAKFDTFRTFPAGSNAFVKMTADPTEPGQILTFVSGGFSLNCKKIALNKATITDKTTEITGEPEYTECTNSLGGAATVKANGCHFRFTSETNEKEHAEVHLMCGTEGTENKPGLTIETAGATITFGSQTLRGIHYYNRTTEPFVGQERHMELTLAATVEKQLHYTCTPAFICGVAGIPTAGTEGSLKGFATITGKEDTNGVEGGNSIGITYETLESSVMPM
jgi:hypothetical protein